MPHKPTDQQQAIIDAGAAGKSILCSAGAGCSKTSTIEMLAPGLPGPATAIAFNVSIKKELEQRLPKTATCLTANGLGHRAWQKVVRNKLIVETGKVGKIVKPILADSSLTFEQQSQMFGDICKLVALAKHTGIIPDGFNYKGLASNDDETWDELADQHWIDASQFLIDICRRVLTESIRQSYQSLIDFDDQIYMSALFGAPYERREIMLVDEAQDLSPINHVQLQRCHPSQLIVVGDPRQAIYGFRGADSNSMGSIVDRFKNLSFERLPLSTTFRCPKVVVARQINHYPEFTAFPTNKEGSIIRLDEWNVKSLPQGTFAILCRNNAPILSMAFKLLRAGQPVQVLGKDIAKNLKNLLKKAISDDSVGVQALLSDIARWENSEIEKVLGRPQREEAVRDRAESMRAICENAKTLSNALDVVDQIFSREGRIILGTGHKAKGLEWDYVLHLDSWRIPSKFAQQAAAAGNDAAMMQEKNLRYVIETRTKDTLAFANLEGWNEA